MASKTTQEALLKAVEELEASGAIVSVRSVQKKIGGGTTHTIAEFLRLYRTRQTDSMTIDRAISDAITNQIRSEIKKATEALTRDLESLQEDNKVLEEKLSQSEAKLVMAEQRILHDKSVIETLTKSLELAQLECQETARLRDALVNSDKLLAVSQAVLKNSEDKISWLYEKIKVLESREETFLKKITE